MICLREQTAEMVAMTCCPFELGSPFPSPEKIHEHSVLPEGKRKERWMPEFHIVLYLACVVVGVVGVFSRCVGWVCGVS